MAEFARTPPALRRLFQLVDLAPLPQHMAVATALDAWRERRGQDLAPRAADMLRDEITVVRDFSFLAEPVQGRADYALSAIGEKAKSALGLEGAESRLGATPTRRLAARLRRLFGLVIDYGEPIDVRFTDRRQSFEILAAPVCTEAGKPALFCTIAVDAPGRAQCHK